MSDPSAAAGPDPRPPLDEAIIYITEQGTQLGVRDNQYVVRDLGTENRDRLAAFPTQSVETICVFGRGVDVTASVRSTAEQTATVINYFTTNGRFRGRFVPSSTTVAPLHRQQYALTRDERLQIAAQIVTGKIANAIRYLRRKRDDGLDGVSTDLLNATAAAQQCTTLDELRGVEGAAAREYFDHFGETLQGEWTLEQRTTRPPEDHTNSLLSLTYTFFTREAESALRQVNLDPYVGVFHAERHGKPALALDLVEEFRTRFADPFVARLINRQTITHEQFTAENHLSDDAFEQYLAKYDGYMDEQVQHRAIERELTRREVIRLQARLLRKRIVGDIKTYVPYQTNQS